MPLFHPNAPKIVAWTLIIAIAATVAALFSYKYEVEVNFNLSVQERAAKVTYPGYTSSYVRVESYNPGYQDCMDTDAAKAFMRDRTWEVMNPSFGPNKELMVEAYEIADPQFPNVGTGRVHCMVLPLDLMNLPSKIRVVDNLIAAVY